MTTRMRARALGIVLLAACAPGDDGADAPATAADTASAGAAVSTPAVFVHEPGADARLVFTGSDSTVRPAEYATAVFAASSMFGVDRDGIPNEFPPADSLAAMLEAAGVSGNRFVIVGDPIPAGRAYAAFDYLGLGDGTALLNGGAGALAPADSGTVAPARPSSADGARGLDIDVRDDMIVDAEWVHARLNDPDVAILDARPPAEFTGATPGNGIARPGHIPGARNVFWQTLIVSLENPVLKDEAELRRIFEEAGADPGDTIVSYCRTGGQASFLYAVARHLGYNVRLYDGSFIDWSRTDYAVER